MADNLAISLSLFAIFDVAFLDEEEDDTFIDISMQVVPAILSILRDDHARVQEYTTKVIPNYFTGEFKRFFRMEPATFEKLLQLIGKCHNKPIRDGGRPAIKLDEQLLISLMYLGSQQTIRSIGDRFDRTDSAMFTCRNKINSILAKQVMPSIIKWPRDDEYALIAETFRPFPGIIGCIDGTHIPIPAPSADPTSYYNRKHFHSILLQGVCLSDLQFTHVLAGWPGRVHDSRVLKNSDVWERIGPSVPDEYHILGDGAYPLRSWLLTPYRDTGHLVGMQRHYNKALSSKRQVIERAFSLLKGRFPRLKYCNTRKLKYTVQAVIASCVLHNVCVLQQDNLEEFANVDDPHRFDAVANNNNNEDEAAGIGKRNQITNLYQ